MDVEKPQHQPWAKDIPLQLDIVHALSQERRQRHGRGLLKALITAGCLLIFVGWNTFWHYSTFLNSRSSVQETKLHHDRPLSQEEFEKLFLSIPSSDSALAASRHYATHPHLAGSPEDFSDAKVILQLFQREFGIEPPREEPIFDAGTLKSRISTLGLTSPLRSRSPSAWIDTYYPVLNTPLDRHLEILAKEGTPLWKADLVEDGNPLDKDAHKYRDHVPTWHGLSKHGEAEGQLVYANYGTKEDYDELVAAGANLTGKVVITRYGNIFRGLKIKRAQELGAAGVLIYSDPRDDGFVTVENGYAPYPIGPARNPSSVQRGSVQFLSMYPGDPTTPGYPSYKDTHRGKGENIPRIPSLPISWSNAERLLEEIGDYYFPELDKTGKTRLSGKASDTTIKLVNHVDNKVTPIWNTMAAIPGHIRDEVVLVGCHRDAWVLGAADPISGTVSLHEVIRGFGALLRSGWKPLRTIVFASWDAEEYGLVGSTEYGEDFASWISAHVVAYINVDVSVTGSSWFAAGSPSLAHLIRQTALDVPHPSSPGKSLWDAILDKGPFTGSVPGTSQNVTIDLEYLTFYEKTHRKRLTSKTGIPPLGSGSDFTVFLQRLGVASMDQSFRGTPSDAAYHYHSIYDSQRWQEVYADPRFQRHVAVSKHLGLVALRLTDDIVIPLNTTQYALELDDYLDIVEDIANNTLRSSGLRKAIRRLQVASAKLDKEKAKAEKEFKRILEKLPKRHGNCNQRNKLLSRVAAWIKWIYGAYPSYDHMQLHHLVSLEELEDWETTAKLNPELNHSRATHHLPRGWPIHKFIKAAKRVGKVNKKLIAFERGFISEAGIKDREWYRHLGVAPGKWLGYGATTFPALTEALTIEKNETLAAYEASRLTNLLEKLAHKIKP